MVTLSALVSGLDAELVRLGYKASTMVWYRGCWRRLERFFAARGVRGVLPGCGDGVGRRGLRLLRQGAGRHAQTDRCLLVQGRADAGRLRGPRGGAAPLLPSRWSKLAGDGADVVARFQAWLRAAGRAVSTVRTYDDGGRGVRRVRGHPRRAGAVVTPARSRRSSPRWPDTRSRPSSRNCARCGRSSVRVRRGPGRRRRTGRGPGGDVPQAGQDPVGVGPGRRDQDPGRGRPGQPVRETGLRDHPAGHQARAARHRHQTAGVRRLRLAGQPAVRGAGQDRPPGAAAAAERRRLGGDRLHPVMAGRSATARRCSSATPPRSARSPTRTICIRFWSSTPGWRTCRSARNAATACIRCGTRWRPG